MEHHARGLRRELIRSGVAPTAADDFASRLGEDCEAVELADADRQMLRYAIKLTETPHAIDRSDIAQLRSVGFDDRGIHDICCIVGYFAFVNRIANGLGVELEG